MATSPNTYIQALEVAQREAADPSMDWSGYCQRFVRTTYGIPALFSSAWTQWLGADAEDRHVGGDPEDAPLGAALCYKGSGVYGHIVLAARPFANGVAAAWSNDLVAWGDIDKVSRTAATSSWGQAYLGYLTAVNDYDLQLKKARPPKPKQNKRYEAIDKAALRLEHALETALRQQDDRDVATIRDEIRRLRKLYTRLRRY